MCDVVREIESYWKIVCYATFNWNRATDTFERIVICRTNLAIDGKRWASHAFEWQAFYFRNNVSLCVVRQSIVTHSRRFVSFRVIF